MESNTTNISIDPAVVENLSNLQIADSSNKSENETSTLFPKITGKLADLLSDYRSYYSRLPTPIPPPTPIQFTGTVKLHGTHVDIVFSSATAQNPTVNIQSRNRLEVTPAYDNYGVATFLFPLRKEILQLREEFVEAWKGLNPNQKLKEECPLIIAGEWIGPGVQKGVALSKLPTKYFVILSASINGNWMPDVGYGHIKNEAVGIYNVSRGGLFRTSLHARMRNNKEDEMNDMTLEVETECPFGKSFGISGIGEGIVWKIDGELGGNARYWIKTKGPKHQGTHTEGLKITGLSEDVVRRAVQFAEAAVKEERLKQAWEFLVEMGIERNKAATPRFVGWLSKDVEVEEKNEILELGIDVVALRKAIGLLGKAWYFQKLAAQ